MPPTRQHAARPDASVLYKLPDLPYAYDALEPHIDERTMRIHHQKHHRRYVDGLNATLSSYPHLQRQPVEELLYALAEVPEEIRAAVRHFGSGHLNHRLFWQSMSQRAAARRRAGWLDG